MPFLRDINDRPGVWKILKAAIGKDLARFTVPVYMNEPISMIQKVAEMMQYEDFMVQANLAADSKMRLMLITCFGIA